MTYCILLRGELYMHSKLCLRDAKTLRNLNCERLVDSLKGVEMVIY